MNTEAVRLVDADDDDIAYIEQLLDSNGLPASDVRDKPGCFYVAYEQLDADDQPITADGQAKANADDQAGAEGRPVGAGGLEQFDTVALLRSLIVAESRRGEGLGTAICDALERRARERDVETLYLLTTTASPFFAARGYEVIDRCDAPAPIRETTEFGELCPDSATCMRKSLSERE